MGLLPVERIFIVSYMNFFQLRPQCGRNSLGRGVWL